jgi:hypothetical protein
MGQSFLGDFASILDHHPDGFGRTELRIHDVRSLEPVLGLAAADHDTEVVAFSYVFGGSRDG